MNENHNCVRKNYEADFHQVNKETKHLISDEKINNLEEKV